MLTRMNVLVLGIACLLIICGCKALLTDQGKSVKADLQLAVSNQTDYVIVKPEKSTEVDDYAVKTLTNFLFQKTGASFPVILPGQVAPANKHIFVGLSAPALKIAGKDPLAALKDQEYVARSVGTDIVLYGKGMHGNLYAVVDFMENTLGRRWYSGRQPIETPRWDRGDGKPVFTVERNLNVQPFSRKGGFSFTYRMPSYDFLFDFHLQGGMNIFSAKYTNPNAFSLKVMPVLCHTLFGYIPPSPKEQTNPKIFGWVTNKNYFTTNPEFVGMNPEGKRAKSHELCFINPGLRKELTKNVLEHIRILKAEGGERLLIDVSTEDSWAGICCCPGCNELKKKYQVEGGPLFDYLFELCAVVKKKHPDAMIHTLAYCQTRKPPVMPSGTLFPDNLVVQFADSEKNSDVDWMNPVNRQGYEYLLAWRKLTPHVWTWLYPYNGMIDVMVSDIRLMKKADVEGVFFEFTHDDHIIAVNFSELQIYVYNKLLQDVDRDVPALIKEFTDYQYGPAAPLARTYLRDMEEAWKSSSTNMSLSARKGYARQLTGLTPATIRRWQESFDRMESLTAQDTRLQQNVRRLRRGLDYRTLGGWNDLNKACPDYFSDYLVVRKRMGAPPPWMAAQLEDLEMLLKTAGMEKPLPAPFNAMDKSLVMRFVPTRGRGAPKMVMDADAAFGYGAVVNLPDRPFTFGFYPFDIGQKAGLKCSLDSGDIQSGVYRLYHLGEIQVTPNCIVWFSSRSWETNLQLGERLYRPPAPDNDNRYDVHVSLKFDTPIPPTPEQMQGDKFTINTNPPYVLCDQIIFVKTPVKP